MGGALQEREEDRRQWLMYWVVFGSFHLLEFFWDTILGWMPIQCRKENTKENRRPKGGEEFFSAFLRNEALHEEIFRQISNEEFF